ncbi:Mur ligase family protein, partial [uncultured Xanthomonas sp.]
MRISQLESQRVALWGWGREGRAAYAAVRGWEAGIGNGEARRALPLTVFCSAEEAAEIAALHDPALHVETEASAERLAAFDVVIKSPGISPYRPEAQAAAARGTRFIGGTALWFAEHAGVDGVVPGSVCVTGTKGKSTTTALLAHLLRAGGHRTGLVGNIGVPLLEVLAPMPPPQYWAIELSSYQTGDVARSGARPQLALVLNLFPEHLDWHGSQARYIADKLEL